MKIKYAIIFLIMILATNGVFANCNVEISADPPLKGKVSCDCNHEKLECNCNINDSIEVSLPATPINDPTDCSDLVDEFFKVGEDVFLEIYVEDTKPGSLYCVYNSIPNYSQIQSLDSDDGDDSETHNADLNDCADYGFTFYKYFNDLYFKSGYFSSGSNVNCIHNIKNSTTIIDTTPSPFSLTNCNNYKINFYTNGKNIFLKSNMNFTSPDNNINLIANNNSRIMIYQDANSITLPNIIVNSGKKLDIITNSSVQATDKSHGVNIESIFVYPNANLNLNLKSNDGISRGSSMECVIDNDSHRHGTRSGNIKFKTFNITNYGNINITLETGKGGEGVKRDKEDCAGIKNQSGGGGGNSGDLNFDVTNIYNFGNIIFDLKTGNGGNGGYTSIDDAGRDDDWKGGGGGTAGSIFISNIDKIINYENIIFNAIAGDGGNGAMHRAENYDDHCKKGNNGSGGSGGNISDINITTFLNRLNSSKFELNIKNGALGIIDTSSDETCAKLRGRYFGGPGKLGDITIDFLDNKSSNGIKIKSDFSFTESQYALAVVATSNGGNDGQNNGGDMRQLPDLNLKLSNIKINYLSNGSYLPKTIFASIPIDNYEYFNNDIRIKGCYINPTTVDYEIKDHTRIEATNSDVISMLNSEFDLTSNYCPHCEVMPLDDSQNRYTRDYSIFSNINGTINVGDLNVYYSNPLDQSRYYTKRTDNKQLPVYTNKNPISGVFNPKTNNYEYKIEPKDLIYYSHTPEDDIDELNQEDYLFCYGQEYILDGKITTIGGPKNFNFPFVPLRELFSD
jgi:hypothetical protein